MASIENAMAALKEDFEAADEIVYSIYNKYFATFFCKEEEMYEKFKDATTPISDSELEWIITSLPLELMAASNELAQFKQHNEIIKLTIKQRKNKEAEDIDEEYKLMSIVYSCVIDKVERRLTFSKELIMGAKKVWDARKKVEQPSISEVNNDLPDYKPMPKMPLF